MQTLISAFDSSTAARRAMERLVGAGFDQQDVHLQQAGQRTTTLGSADSADAADERADERQIGERTMASAEREVAVDGDALAAIGHFFVSLFGKDKEETHAKRYSQAVGDGRSVVVVDAQSDQEAETAAMILHECGAVDVDDQHHDGSTTRNGVSLYQRGTQPLREIVGQRQARDDSLLSNRAGQISREREERAARDERAFASGIGSPDTDRPN